ncbi:IclR family transcriptional regulator [Pseudomonas oryzihabitans]|uniref:IclR family transcriptional regulator n=1 Tax=Pseudomonas oryzihabitans TaxID=47885 RepID=UPI001238F670|nr:IclR family transcriptional regulator C-terminal domain-containing protein [Pseudomonas oryzihabitans]QEU01784.1 helix-turn-helix domain-containing protein [Pseudomonas oryzihabitans]
MSKQAEATKYRVQSAARTMDVLIAVAGADNAGISSVAISDQIGLPRQVVYHLVHTLVEMGGLRKVGRGMYILGPKIASIAQGFGRQVVGSDMLLSFAEQAASATGETAYVVGWIDDEIVVLATARGAGMLQAVEIPKGTAGDAHARASGKLLLAMTSDSDIDRYLDQHPLTKRTPNTKTSRTELARELANVRAHWVSREREEYELGLSCVAIPLGKVPSTLVLGISAPTQRLEQRFDEQLSSLRVVADTFN